MNEAARACIYDLREIVSSAIARGVPAADVIKIIEAFVRSCGVLAAIAGNKAIVPTVLNDAEAQMINDIIARAS